MVIGLLSATLSIPEAGSLKEKRSVIRSLKDRVRNHMNISVAEVGSQDKWRTADMAFVTVATDRKTVDKRLSAVDSLLRRNPRHIVTDIHTELF